MLFDSNADNLEEMFEEVKKVLPRWELQIAPKNTERRLCHLGYNICYRKLEHKQHKLGETDYRLLMTFKDC